MKTIAFIIGFALMALLLPLWAYGGERYVTCDPQIADGYSYNLDYAVDINGDPVWIDVPYQTIISDDDGLEYAAILNIESLADGPHTIEVLAFFNDYEHGRVESATNFLPFVKTVTGGTIVIQAPANMGVIQGVLSSQ